MSHFACRNFRSIDASFMKLSQAQPTHVAFKASKRTHSYTHICTNPPLPHTHTHQPTNHTILPFPFPVKYTHTMHTQMIERRNTIHLSKDKAAFHPSRITFRNCECTNATWRMKGGWVWGGREANEQTNIMEAAKAEYDPWVTEKDRTNKTGRRKEWERRRWKLS